MSLTTAITALLTCVRAYNSGATFTSANSSYAEYAVLDAAGYEVAAIVDVAGDATIGDTASEGALASGVQSGFGSQGKLQELYELSITVAYKRGVGEGGNGALKQSLTTLTDALLAYLITYPRLNGASGIRRALPYRRNLPYDIAPAQPEGAPSTHLVQDIFVRVWAETTPAYVESF